MGETVWEAIEPCDVRKGDRVRIGWTEFTVVASPESDDDKLFVRSNTDALTISVENLIALGAVFEREMQDDKWESIPTAPGTVILTVWGQFMRLDNGVWVDTYGTARRHSEVKEVAETSGFQVLWPRAPEPESVTVTDEMVARARDAMRDYVEDAHASGRMFGDQEHAEAMRAALKAALGGEQ